MIKVVKVVNISSKTVEVARVEIKPHKVHIFKELTDLDRAKISAMVAVCLVKAYEDVIIDKPTVKENVETDIEDVNSEPKKQTKKSRKK